MQFEESFVAFKDDVMRTAMKLCGDEQLAEDAVQHAYLKGFINRETLLHMPEKALKAWLMTTARNHVFDHFRRRSRIVCQLSEEIPAAQEDPTDKILAEKLMAVLDDDLKLVVHLRYYEGLNSTQIGQVLGLPASTVRSRLRKAINEMKKQLED